MLTTIGDARTCPVALIFRNRKILLGHRHYTFKSDKPLSVWTCPGGRCEDGESLETTLRREIKEETGITDLVIEKYLGEFSGAKTGDRVPVFHCKTTQEASLCEPEKFSEWAWFGTENFPDVFINEGIKSVIIANL